MEGFKVEPVEFPLAAAHTAVEVLEKERERVHKRLAGLGRRQWTRRNAYESRARDLRVAIDALTVADRMFADRIAEKLLGKKPDRAVELDLLCQEMTERLKPIVDDEDVPAETRRRAWRLFNRLMQPWVEGQPHHLAARPSPDQTTVNCERGDHRTCGGYVAPLVYSNTRPCRCTCHVDGVDGKPFQPRTLFLVGDTIESYNEKVAKAVRK